MGENDLILALDLKVLSHIMKRYKNYIYKTKLFTFKNNSTEVKDLFKMVNDQDYFNEMEKILETSNIIVNDLIKN